MKSVNIDLQQITFFIAVLALALIIMFMYAQYQTWQAQIEFNESSTWILETHTRSIDTIVEILKNQLTINNAIFNRLP